MIHFLKVVGFELRQALVPRWPLNDEQVWLLTSVVRWTIRIIVALSIPILVGYAFGITLWDWMKLLLTPLAIAGVGIWVNGSFGQREAAEIGRADRRAQMDAYEAYLNNMITLLVDKNLREAQLGDHLSTAARALTLAALAELFHNPKKSDVLRFLYESKLIGTTDDDPIISLEGAQLPGLFMPMPNLRGANLQRTNMVDAELTGVHLQGANLQEAYLGGAYLGEAKLRDAQLQHTRLPMADLNGADLAGTDLRGAELFQANLAGVDLSKTVGLTQAQLYVALGDPRTQVPHYLEQPEAWITPIEEQRLRLSQL